MKKIEEANKYFLIRTQRVFVDRCNSLGVETFAKYLSHRYRDSCYNYSLYAIMGLKSKDLLLRGYIDIKGIGICNYHHGWIEFTYDDEEYIFDNHFEKVVPKEEWYNLRKPEINYQKTQKEILDMYLNETYASKIEENYWHMNKVVYAGYVDFHQLHEIEEEDKKQGYVPGMLGGARIELSNSTNEVIKFIAYDPPSG